MVNTHHHEDHSGGKGAFRAFLGLPVAVPSEAHSVLTGVPRLRSYRRLVWCQAEEVDAQPPGDVVVTSARRFLVIPTPGHSPDHVCFFEPER
ncbi:MAG: MBL fold metallo-hydrolase [Anaerolineae bacterium]|jgi:glyoxylase-like metal-dependent hydrolase (beta-lactamase superfamily II)